MNKKKLLFIAYYYYPDISIGAVRPTKLVKYLSDKYIVDVLTVKRPGASSATYAGQYAHHIYEIPYKKNQLSEWIDRFRKLSLYRILRQNDRKKRLKNTLHKATQIPNTQKKQTKGVFECFVEGISRVLRRMSDDLQLYQRNVLDEDVFTKVGCKHIKDNKKLFERYDVVISTREPDCVHDIALLIKRQCPHIKWIADFRDPCLTGGEPLFYVIRQRLKLCRIKKSADYITAVSDEFLNVMGLKPGECNIVISNGYDPDDFNKCTLEKNYNDGEEKLSFVYTGQIAKGKYDLMPFFEVLRQCIKEGSISENRLRIIYAGVYGFQFRQMAEVYGCENLIEDRGEVTMEESHRLQQMADILLLASINTDKERGRITGKFYEYLAAKHPIICCIKGNRANSKLKRLINKYRLGYCYEEATIETDRKEIYGYLKKILLEYKKRGNIGYNPDERFIRNCAYNKIASKLSRIID